MKKSFGILCMVALFLSFAAAASATPFGNGSFESGIPSIGNYVTLGVGASGIDSWNVVSGYVTLTSTVDYIGGYWQASDGNRSIDLDGYYTPGAIAQTFDTTPGVEYLVLFDMAGNPDNPSIPIKRLEVTAAGYSSQYQFDVTGKSRSNMGWTTMSFYFTAADWTTTLMFASLMPAGSAFGPALDNVRVASAPVPEPATMLLLGSGLVGLAGFRKRFLKK